MEGTAKQQRHKQIQTFTISPQADEELPEHPPRYFSLAAPGKLALSTLASGRPVPVSELMHSEWNWPISGWASRCPRGLCAFWVLFCFVNGVACQNGGGFGGVWLFFFPVHAMKIIGKGSTNQSLLALKKKEKKLRSVRAHHTSSTVLGQESIHSG